MWAVPTLEHEGRKELVKNAQHYAALLNSGEALSCAAGVAAAFAGLLEGYHVDRLLSAAREQGLGHALEGAVQTEAVAEAESVSMPLMPIDEALMSPA